MLGHYLPSGVLGLGLTALMASFMSGHGRQRDRFQYGMDLRYIPELHSSPGQTDKHYLRMGQIATIFGISSSMGTAYVASNFNNIMDFLQLDLRIC